MVSGEIIPLVVVTNAQSVVIATSDPVRMWEVSVLPMVVPALLTVLAI